MSALRVLVSIASLFQVGVGVFAAYHILQTPTPDLFGLILCSTIIVAGLTSICGLFVQKRPSGSRLATVKLNVLILGLIVMAAAVLLLVEQHQGILTEERTQFLVIVFAICGAPFLINAFALALLDRQARKFA